jgi:hypothetical protein
MRAAAALSRRFGNQQLLKITPGTDFICRRSRFAAIRLQVKLAMGGRRPTMKTLTMTAVILALLAMPAHAQARRPGGEEKKTDQKKPVVDENAYKAALERIPDSKEKYDPWSITKPAEPAKKPK